MGIPLRNWGRGTASYDPKTGRASSAFVHGATTIEGESIQPSSQVDSATTKGEGGAPGWSEYDQRNTQGGGRAQRARR
jgi:hypothetical protein